MKVEVNKLGHQEVNWDLISNTQCSCGNSCVRESCPCMNIPCSGGGLKEIKDAYGDDAKECACEYRGCNEDCNCNEGE